MNAENREDEFNREDKEEEIAEEIRFEVGSTQAKFTTLLIKVIDNIKSVFTNTPNSKEQIELIGRISVIKENSAEILIRLQMIRDQINEQFDPKLSGLVSSFINPMLSKMQRIQETLIRSENVAEQSSRVAKYNEWISNASGWIEWYSQESDQDKLIQFISQNIFSDGCKLVDKDVQFILDYQALVLNDLLIDPEHKNDLRKRLDKAIFPHIVALQKLKDEPEGLDLETIASWKEEVDTLRSFHVNEAIHRIDGILEGVIHFKPDYEE